ncbi:MAG: hypothetical protein R3C14_48465 [Caldilineaceae bacterium]
MSSEQITVYIDQGQLAAQKKNKYSLYLAKLVNNEATVIWQSRGPVATVGHQSYEYQNIFDVSLPSFQVNYANDSQSFGAGSSFTSAGKSVSINVGQTVTLDQNGIFGNPANGGNQGAITITNQLQANPHAILMDATGNNIFVNTDSGMDIGNATLTPLDQYQIWFGNYQDTGTIIADNRSNVASLTLTGGEATVITYNADGEWIQGAPPPANWVLPATTGEFIAGVTVIAMFRATLTTAALTYLGTKLIGKFTGNLKPSEITVAKGDASVTFKFSNASELLTHLGTDVYEQAVDSALASAQKDATSGLQHETWKLSEAEVAFSSMLTS